MVYELTPEIHLGRRITFLGTTKDGVHMVEVSINAKPYGIYPTKDIALKEAKRSIRQERRYKNRLHSSLERYSERDLIEMCRAREGWAVSEQLESILNGQPLSEQNYNALKYIVSFLKTKKEHNMAKEIQEFLDSDEYYDEEDE